MFESVRLQVYCMLFCCVVIQSGVTALTAVNHTLTTVDADALLQCIKDHPNDRLVWMKDKSSLNQTDKYSIADDPISSNLTIRTAGEADVGLYLCIDQNSKETHVALNAKPFADTAISKSVSVTEGETVVLKCSGWGFPIPYILWTREPFMDHIYGVSDSGVSMADLTTAYNVTLKNAQLELVNMNQTDQTNYLCILHNDFGNATITVYVRVKDRLAAVWPFIGIVLEVVILIVFIVVCEIKRKKKAMEDDNDAKNK